jgi:hypothetical protein
MPTPYFCSNRSRPDPARKLLVQDGYITVRVAGLHGVVTLRQPNMVEVACPNTTDCLYDRSALDARCAGCNNAPHLRIPQHEVTA